MSSSSRLGSRCRAVGKMRLIEPHRRRSALHQSRRHARHGETEAVATFTDTFSHVKVVEACAPRHIPVMMEKPLAVDMNQAHAIQQARSATARQ